MRHPFRGPLQALPWMLALCLLAPAAQASTVMSMDVPALTRGSDLVVRGRVLSTASRAHPETGRIVTDVEVAVDETLKGTVERPTLRIVQPGGTVGGVRQHVSGAPDLKPGEEVVLFLAHGVEGPRVVGLSQGHFRVQGTHATEELPSDLELLDPVSLQPVSRAARTVDLRTLRAQVLAEGGGTVASASRMLPAQDGTLPPYVRSRVPGADPSTAHCLWWEGDSTLTFHQQQCSATEPDCTERQGAVSLALKSWGDVLQECASLRIAEGAATASRQVGYTPNGANANIIVLRERTCTKPDEPDCWEHAAETVALTTVSFQQRTGQVLDADIELNAVFFASAGSVDLQSAVTHELGHALGLDHSPDPSSTMYFSASQDPSASRVIDPGSQQAMCDIYPPGAPALDCVEGTESPAEQLPLNPHGCSSTAGGAGPLLAGLLALMWPWRRGRRGEPC